VILRDAVRGLYLAPFIRIHELPARTQLDLLVLFLVAFGLGLFTVAWMLRAVVRGRQRS